MKLYRGRHARRLRNSLVVVGLLVAIPAMFAYNFMVTTIRAITQELDGFAARYATQIDHAYVENRNLEEKIADAFLRFEDRKELRPVYQPAAEELQSPG